MANIFKTTLKKDVIADIECNNIREVRFPITKFWATRLSDNFDLDKKIFDFKTFKTLEFSAPSNKGTDATTHVFGFVKTYVDGEEFVVEFSDIKDDSISISETTCIDVEQVQEEIEVISEDTNDVPMQEEIEVASEDTNDVPMQEEIVVDDNENEQKCEVEEVVESVDVVEDVVETKDKVVYVDNINVNKNNDKKFGLYDVKQWFEEKQILESFYKDDSVFATNAIQIMVLPKGKVLGFKKSLPVNNDVPVRIEFDSKERVYFNTDQNFDIFKDSILKTIKEIRKNNFVFVCKRNTGIFVDKSGGIYFGIKYSTRKSVGFNRKYNVQ